MLELQRSVMHLNKELKQRDSEILQLHTELEEIKYNLAEYQELYHPIHLLDNEDVNFNPPFSDNEHPDSNLRDAPDLIGDTTFEQILKSLTPAHDNILF